MCQGVEVWECCELEATPGWFCPPHRVTSSIMQSIEISSAPGSMIWSLPSDLLENLIESYLTPHDIARLDRACCSHQTRQHYLEALRNNCEIKALYAWRYLPNLLKWIENRAATVINLTIQEFGEVKLESINSVLDHIKTIELAANMWASHEAWTASTLSANVAHKVRKITFSDNLAYDGEIFEVAWLDGSELRNLQELTCSVGSECTEWTLRLIENNPHLHTLDLRCLDERDEFFDRLLRSTSMRSISLNFNDDEELLIDPILRKIASCYPNLECLKVTSSAEDFEVDILSTGLVELARGCPHLREVHLHGEIELEESALTEFFATAHYLRVFSAGDAYFNDAMLLALAQSNGGMPHLEELGMRLELENEETIRQCGATLAHLRRCSGVVLGCSGYALAYACMRNLVELQVSLQHLPLVAEHCPAVRKLTLDTNVLASTVNSLDYLLRYLQDNPSLESVNLDDIVVTSELLTGLAHHCPNLCSLTAMVPITGVTTSHLVDLVRHCPRLINLNLHDVGPDAFTDAVLIALAQHSYYLEELRLPQGTCLDDAGLNALVSSCKHLRVIRGCQWIRTIQRQSLCRLARSRGRLLQFDDEV